MKYALYEPADQTIVYHDINGHLTTRPADAKLYNTLEEAKAAQAYAHKAIPDVHPEGHPYAGHLICEVSIEEIEDEDEFKARRDTW